MNPEDKATLLAHLIAIKPNVEWKAVNEVHRAYAFANNRDNMAITTPVFVGVTQTVHYVVTNNGDVCRIPFDGTRDSVTWRSRNPLAPYDFA